VAHLSCGIVGLPNVGKSTLFNALTRAQAAVAPYPFCTIDPNVGVVPVRDVRVERVAQLAGVSRIVYAAVEFVDVAGLVKGASRGAGRGNQFLDHLRHCDALVHVVRCFEDPDVPHVPGAIQPAEDIRTVALELMLADLETVRRAAERIGKLARHESRARAEAELLERVRQQLDREQPARSLALSAEERAWLAPLKLLTAKPVLYAANLGEAELRGGGSPRLAEVEALAAREHSAVVALCAKWEEELAGLAPEEAELFLRDAGWEESGLQRLARAAARLLGLISFITFNEQEARAWTIPQGATAQQAAGVIHSDFAEHFIRAEVTPYADFVAAGGARGAREHGRMRVEGREYVVQDGDVIYFRVGV